MMRAVGMRLVGGCVRLMLCYRSLFQPGKGRKNRKSCCVSNCLFELSYPIKNKVVRCF